MKRIVKISVIVLLVLMISPLSLFAAPQGYLEVELTKSNFKQYFEVVKMKHYDVFGDYNGYSFVLKSKYLKDGYYLYSASDFAIKYSVKEKVKYKYKKKTRKATYRIKTTVGDIFGNIAQKYYKEFTYNNHYNNNYEYNFKYAKLSNFKVLQVKGKLIYIEPSNIISIEHIGRMDNLSTAYHELSIKLKYPYDNMTPRFGHYDYTKHDFVTDFYYMNIDYENVNSDGKTPGGVIMR